MNGTQPTPSKVQRGAEAAQKTRDAETELV